MSSLENIISALPEADQQQLRQVLLEKRELQQRFEVMRTIINTAGDGFIAVDENHKIVDVSNKLKSMFGYANEELKGQDLSILLPTGTHTKHRQIMQQFGEKEHTRIAGNSRERPLHGIHKTHGAFPVEIAISHIQLAGKKIYTAFVRDRTIPHTLERNLENQAKALKNRVRELEAFQELAKLGAEDDIDGIISKFIVDVVPKSTEYPDKTVTIIELEGRVHRNTTRKPVVHLTAPLLDGQLTFGFTEEIPFHSENKQNLLNAYASELGEIIKRKKAETSRMQAEREAAKNGLSVDAALNVSSGLQSILNLNELALKSATSREARELLQKIKNIAQGLALDVRGLAQSAEHSSSKNEFEVFDLGKTVREYLNATKTVLISEGLRRGVSISFNTTCGLDNSVNGKQDDVALIAQALIKNAAEAMIQDGTIDIDVQAQDGFVRLRVTDTGKGMDAETQKRLFDPYLTSQDHEPGKGLSLSTAQNIAKDHGGEISLIHSNPGQGTSFELRLPCAQQEERKKESAALNILWAEDDDVVKMIAQQMTKNLGHNIEFVSDGQQALEMLNKRSFDLLITDLSMPRMSGWQLLKSVFGRFEHMPRVIASGYLISKQDMQRHGADYTLDKPLEQQNLLAILDNVAKGNTPHLAVRV